MNEEKPLGTHLSELRRMTVTYVRQEITDPLKGAGRYVKLGLLGGLAGILAGVMVALGALRGGQALDIADISRGAWSWLVYVIVGLVVLIVGVVFIMVGVRSGRRGDS